MNASSSVGPSDGDKKPQVLSCQGHQGRREDGNSWKQNSPQPRWQVPSWWSVVCDDCFQIICQSDGNNGKVGGQSEHGKQGQEIIRYFEREIAAGLLGFEGEGVEVGHGGEGEDAGVAEDQVEGGDQEVVGPHDGWDLGALPDWSDQAGYGVMTHEGVHGDTEDHRGGGELDHGRRAVLHTGVGHPEDGQADHGDEGHPPHHTRPHLEILGLGQVEVGEGPEEGDEDGHVDLVDVGLAEAGLGPPAGLGRDWLAGVGGCEGTGDVTEGLGHGRAVDGQVSVQVGDHADVEDQSGTDNRWGNDITANLTFHIY